MRAILTLILGLPTANAMAADWRLVDYTDDGGKHFVDAGSIRINGSMRRVWARTNYGTARKDGTQSSRNLWELDCREGRLRIMQSAWFSMPDNKGSSFGTTGGASEWTYAAPSTVGESILKFGCAKK